MVYTQCTMRWACCTNRPTFWSQFDKFDSHDNEFPVQIAQLKDAMLKKYSEIEWPLQSLKDLSCPAESCLGQETFKFKPVTASIWCISTHPGSLPHSSNTLTDAANGSTEENSYCKSIDYVKNLHDLSTFIGGFILESQQSSADLHRKSLKKESRMQMRSILKSNKRCRSCYAMRLSTFCCKLYRWFLHYSIGLKLR
jgi:hypothetical protein